MKEIIVKTQQEWDALPEKFDQETRIVIDAEPDRIITLTKNKSNSYVDITGTSFVHLSGVFIVREMREALRFARCGKLSGSRDGEALGRRDGEALRFARCGKALRSA